MTLKNQGVQEGWTYFKKERNLKGARAACPYVPKDELTGKTTGQDGQGGFERSKGRDTPRLLHIPSKISRELKRSNKK